MNKITTSVQNALAGLAHAYRLDKSFRMEVWGSIGFAIIIAILSPLSGIEFILITLAYLLILITELINTAVEQMLERLHPKRHELIGKSKDIASSAVLMAFVFAIVVVVVLIGTHFF